MLYMGYKGVNDAAHPPEGGLAEVGSLSASSLPLLDNARKRQSQQQINAVGLKAGANITFIGNTVSVV